LIENDFLDRADQPVPISARSKDHYFSGAFHGCFRPIAIGGVSESPFARRANHDSVLGKAPADALFDRVKVGRAVDDEFRNLDDRGLGNLPPARKFADYAVTIDREKLPVGVEIVERL
jgi:hypothetical protein